MAHIGANIYNNSLFTEAEMLRGKIPAPGTRQKVNVGGQTKEFVTVKLPAATYVNGTVITIPFDPSGISATASVPVKTEPTGGRLGILVIASATATITAAGTAYAWAQIFGPCLARCSATGVSSVGMNLCPGGALGSLHLQVVGTASQHLQGITAIATSAGAVLLLNVMLNYPVFVKTDELA
jgi:hypothetical protein